MDKYLNKAKSKLQDKLQPLLQDRNDSSNGSQQQHHSSGPPPIPPKPLIPLTSQQSDRPSAITRVTPLDVLRYRYQHGANLGSIYVLEKWLFPAMFPGSCAGHGKSSELAAVRASVDELGMDGAREKFERHWAGAVTDADLDWLVGKAKCNTIRLPIGYFTLGPSFLTSPTDPFHRYAPVYANAWSSVRTLVARLRARGIGTLLDLHGLPGGANGCDHSGTDAGKAGHWRSRGCRAHSARCLAWIAEQVRGDDDPALREGVVGLQLVNEAEWAAEGLWEWYDDVVRAVAAVDPGLPVYVSDAWDLGKAVQWAAGANKVGVGARVAPVVVDTHLYWCFADKHKKMGPEEVVREAKGKLGLLDKAEGDVLKKGAVAAVVGEYSCVLSEETWKKGGGQKGRDEWAREFGQALSARFQQKAMGSHFWTYKMQWMPGGEWGFKACTEKGAITPHWTLTLTADDVRQRLEVAQAQRDERFGQTFAQHCGYWDNNSPGTQFEHWRYEQGWKQGFDDAAAFFGMRVNGGYGDVGALGEGGAGGGVGGDKIGSLEVWVRRRLIESGMGGPCVWEYEQGLRKGVGEFCELAGGL
ncbi:putative glucanbeta-glucosidase [Diplodia seriata]|uniref:Putative glucanbeta-glucosidase n=1 Tax=Diplodia seriata TaxID=420778 RepID=A0A0G2F1N3_9PEZI|nr:putative glucanbeta-glucosidase [Diplodia seriata]